MRRNPLRAILGTAMSRRRALQLAQLAGLGACGAGLGLFGKKALAEREVKGTCRICTMHCGVIATSRGSRLLRVEGDPASQTKGFVCHHGWALREVVHSHHRIRRPLRREEGGFREVPWEQALAEIASRLNQVKAQYGPQALAIQTGWPFVRHPLIHMLHRFCQAFGTPNLATVASQCEAAGRMGKALTYGSNARADLRHARTLVVWGANPTFTAPPFAHLCEAMSLDGKKLIVVDPIRTELAERATLHLQVRPGSDGALALAMAQVLLSLGLYHKHAEEAVGFEEFRLLAAQFPPERAAEVTSVPAAKIAEAARMFAQHGPASVWDGLGIEHHRSGLQTVRAVAALSALCGYVDVPGGAQLMNRPGPGFFGELLPPLYRLATPEPLPPKAQARPIGYEEIPLYEVFNRQAQGMLFPRAILEDKPYPLRALILIGSNALVTSPGSARMLEAAEKLELLVTVDPFLTASGERSDYVLPAATFAEAVEVGPGEEDAKVARSSLVPEQHQSWPDWKVLFELARALGLGRYFPWGSFQEAIDAPRVPFMRDESRALTPLAAAPGTPLPRFPTPSGRIELRSGTMERFGAPPLPEWTEPGEKPTAEFPFILLTGPRTRPYINSQFRRIPSIAGKMPEPLAELHPEAARRAGVKDGQRVAVVSLRGRIVLRARVTERIHPETVVLPAGWENANANLLTDGGQLDPLTGFPAYRSLTCRVEPA
ncbi:MAG: molybdopterin-dependent oxidoreductase [Myxococcales bacterium]|nr:molybdopterin-dependent oxidoreductase [Myxococcales bacterium]